MEQYVDYTPIRVLDVNGTPVMYGASQLQTEFEYGISDRLELGLYVTFAPSSGLYNQVPPLTEGNGVKERLRLRLAEAGEWPVDIGLYGELVGNERELELEAKIILERHIGDLRVVANLWGEREYENFDSKQGDWVINPTLGVTYQVTPASHPGIESWLRAEYPDSSPPRTFKLGPQASDSPDPDAPAHRSPRPGCRHLCDRALVHERQRRQRRKCGGGLRPRCHGRRRRRL